MIAARRISPVVLWQLKMIREKAPLLACLETTSCTIFDTIAGLEHIDFNVRMLP